MKAFQNDHTVVRFFASCMLSGDADDTQLYQFLYFYFFCFFPILGFVKHRYVIAPDTSCCTVTVAQNFPITCG